MEDKDAISRLHELGFTLDDVQRLLQRNDTLTVDDIVRSVEEYAARGGDVREMLREERGDAEGDNGDLPPPKLATIAADVLQKKEIPPLTFRVENLITNGLALLASPPKYGKSWMVLDLCLDVANGRNFLGYKTNRCACLYLALEDGERRLKDRMNKLLMGLDAPDNFFFATTASTTDNGLLEMLDGFVAEHPDTGLIVIDTFQRIRARAQTKESAYAADYREIGQLKVFADTHHLALVLVHHLRKAADDGDPFNRISGTAAISGAADAMIVLSKAKRSDANATLSAVGRDIESIDLALRFNSERCFWENLGDADAVAEQRARAEYAESPITTTIKKLLAQSPEGWTGTAQEFLDAGRYIAHVSLATSARELTAKLKALDQLLLDNDGIVHERKRNGSGGGKHRFYRPSPWVSEAEEAEPMV